jgi:hypothetical protein
LVDLDALKRLEAEARKRFPSRFFVPNGKQEQFMRMVGGCAGADGRVTTLNVFSAGNGVGKTAIGPNILAQIVYGQHGEWTKGCPYYENWPFPKRARILGTHSNLKETGAIHEELTKWLVPGTYERIKDGQEYFSVYNFPDYGWSIKLMTYDQDPKELEGPTLGLIWADEPMPEAFVGPAMSRLREGGLFMNTMTPLSGGAWVFDKMEEKHPDWGFVFADVEDNCVDHGVRGHLKHTDVQRIIEAYPPEEREARKSGKFMFLSGRVYKDWSADKHVTDWPVDKVARQLQESNLPPTIYMCLDPHDVKPWVMTWWAVYKSGLCVCFMEWPDDSMGLYHDTDEYTCGLREYVEIIRRKESNIKIHRRWADRNYITARRQRTDGATSIGEELRKFSNGELAFWPSQGNPSDNRALVASALRPRAFEKRNGESVIMPALLVDRSCKNMIYAMDRWMWSKSSGKALETKDRIQPVPQDKDKCFPNTAEFLFGGGAKWLPPEDWLYENEFDDLQDVSHTDGIRTGYNY